MAVEHSGRLELTWTNKHLRLLADQDGGYTWVPPADYRVAEVRLLHDAQEVGETRGPRSRAKDNLLIQGDALSALTSLCELPEFAREYVGKAQHVSADAKVGAEWRYLLASEEDVEVAHGSWAALKSSGN